MPKNEEKSGSEQVQSRPSKELFGDEGFFPVLKFEIMGEMDKIKFQPVWMDEKLSAILQFACSDIASF
jgi:hypothetical protein